MQATYSGQANEVGLPIVAKASGNPITAGTINFYLRDVDTGDWFQGSDQTWQSSESIAGAGGHVADGHWSVSLPTEAWLDGHRYRLYAKESGDLHIPVADSILCLFANLLRISSAWLMGIWRDKPTDSTVKQLLDPVDGTTVILEIALSETTPYKTVTVKI